MFLFSIVFIYGWIEVLIEEFFVVVSVWDSK